jgi:DNA polymerase-1
MKKKRGPGRPRKIRNTLLIDADILVFRTAIACEETVCWDKQEELWTLTADMKEAKSRVEDEVAHLMEVLGGTYALMCFSDRPTFRHKMYSRYKANRKNRRPVIFGPLREWVKQTWPWECWPELEADDVMGILSKSHAVPSPKIVVSDDHDLESVPCNLYQPMHPERGVRKITYAKARRNHLKQTLTGDSGDNYPGCPGVGPKRAEAILKEGTWKEVVEAYAAKGLNEEEALLQARLAQILPTRLYDINTHKVTLWKPRKS